LIDITQIKNLIAPQTFKKPFFALEDLFEEKQPQKTLGDFFGVLAENDFQQLKEYTTQARKEWDRVF